MDKLIKHGQKRTGIVEFSKKEIVEYISSIVSWYQTHKVKIRRTHAPLIFQESASLSVDEANANETKPTKKKPAQRQTMKRDSGRHGETAKRAQDEM